MSNPVRYYVYVSSTKVDMLYSQIPPNFLKNIVTELKLDLKLPVADVGATLKPNQPADTYYSKLRIVEKYLEEHFNVGWPDAPQAYFKGSLPMHWGVKNLPDEKTPTLAYFGGTTGRTILGLCGSPQHIVAYKNASSMDSLSPSVLPALLSILDHLAPALGQTQELRALHAVEYLTTNMEGPLQNLEFLARELAQGQKENSHTQILLGSPIYVALLD